MKIASPTYRASALVLAILFCLAGCDRKPTAAKPPALDPAAIAAGAMTAYDSNGDGQISGDELEKAASVVDHPS
ncbi:MAG: hypothetical protein KDA41_13535, partial [Planctomycetales bacterium]|nr:hypothetical protein [Planctomycetales bacterium]